RWLASRGETFLADYQGRGQAADAEMAFDAEGHVQAFRVRVLADLGAYLGPRGSTAPTMWQTMGTSVYHFPAVDYDVRAIHTHNMPTCPYRGAGAPEAIFVIERLLDMAAAELGLTVAAIRRRNLVPASAMPYRTAIGTTLDSGDFAKIMQTAEEMADLPGFAARKADSAARGRLRGIGYGNLLEACGAGIADRAVVSCLPDGRLVVRIGTMSNGQSHETVYAQMLADCIGIDMNKVEIVQGDSNETPWGMGTGASRSMTVCGSALVLAAEELVEKGRKIAADLLEAAEVDISYGNATYTVSGTDRRLPRRRGRGRSGDRRGVRAELRDGAGCRARPQPDGGGRTIDRRRGARGWPSAARMDRERPEIRTIADRLVHGQCAAARR
ncbi:MAG: molybdopterin cofactor-binding domain-containing protein, partial [Rickettsiales bacterium]